MQVNTTHLNRIHFILWEKQLKLCKFHKDSDVLRNFGQNSVIILKNSVLLKMFLRQCYKVLRVSKV